ncbi:MAG TPA: RNase adapter RapZ [Gammaproteobacteria bacterium]|nr:RNase adapter RapZ [Gammaproteobacteria bacterium]
MKLLIISGLSGSGKSTVLHVLEDMGFYCIDNLPVALLARFAEQMLNTAEKIYEFSAVGIDARNRGSDLAEFPSVLAGLRNSKLACQVIFLDAEDNILIKRYSETRRKHPLTHENISLGEAIKHERELLDPISQEADLYLQTSNTNLHQLRDLIKQRLNKQSHNTLSLLFLSFGFKHGLPIDADIVFDVRCLPNPYWKPELREHTGQEQPVIKYLDDEPMVQDMLNDLTNYGERWIPRIESADRTYLTFAVGCTGGHHRSVYLVDRLAKHFANQYDVISRHRELE